MVAFEQYRTMASAKITLPEGPRERLFHGKRQSSFRPGGVSESSVRVPARGYHQQNLRRKRCSLAARPREKLQEVERARIDMRQGRLGWLLEMDFEVQVGSEQKSSVLV